MVMMQHLPPELLLHIFQFLQVDEKEEQALKEWFHLSLVCKRFHKVASGLIEEPLIEELSGMRDVWEKYQPLYIVEFKRVEVPVLRHYYLQLEVLHHHVLSFRICSPALGGPLVTLFIGESLEEFATHYSSTPFYSCTTGSEAHNSTTLTQLIKFCPLRWFQGEPHKLSTFNNPQVDTKWGPKDAVVVSGGWIESVLEWSIYSNTEERVVVGQADTHGKFWVWFRLSEKKYVSKFSKLMTQVKTALQKQQQQQQEQPQKQQQFQQPPIPQQQQQLTLQQPPAQREVQSDDELFGLGACFIQF